MSMAEDVPRVRVILEPGARSPEYKSLGAAGADLRALLKEPIHLGPGARAAVPTGIRMEIPDGWEGQIRPRSGLALEHGITCINSPGTVDSDYRGEIKVLLVNASDREFTIRDGDRIAQIVIAPARRVFFEIAPTLSETERGGGGFGSTGI